MNVEISDSDPVYTIGIVADKFGVHMSFIVPVLSYLYLTYYGISGYKPAK